MFYGADGALGFPGRADLAAEKNQPQREVAPLISRDEAHEVEFDFLRVPVPGEPEPVGYPRHMGVDDNARRAEGSAEHHIGSLAPDPGKLDQFLQLSGHTPAVMFDEGLAAGLDISGLVPIKAGWPDQPLDFSDRCGYEILRPAHALEQHRGDAINLLVGALGRKNGGHQQLERIAVKELRLDPGVDRVENPADCLGAFA